MVEQMMQITDDANIWNMNIKIKIITKMQHSNLSEMHILCSYVLFSLLYHCTIRNIIYTIRKVTEIVFVWVLLHGKHAKWTEKYDDYVGNHGMYRDICENHEICSRRNK